MIYLSPSKLNILKECKRCFWLDAHKVLTRPRGIFSSLPNAIDLLLKEHYDNYRHDGLVPEIQGAVTGVLYHSNETINKYRNWRTCPKYQIGEFVVRGAIDDLISEADGTYTPLDYKTKGSIPEDGYAEKYYQLQMDLQALMLMAGAGHKPSGKAHLAFYSLLQDDVSIFEDPSNVVSFDFEVTIKTVETSIQRAKDFVDMAIAIYEGEMPEGDIECEYCNYLHNAEIKLGLGMAV